MSFLRRSCPRFAFSIPPIIGSLIIGAIVSLLVMSAGVVIADDPQLNEQLLKKAKHATVQLRVKLSDDQVVEGSGWFAFEPGLVITNAHVLGMIDPDSRRPQLIEVVIDSAESNSRTVKAKFLGMDRTCDLAVVKVEGTDLPEPLPLGVTTGLNETQTVFIFGFPFGKKLGKNITVSKSSVSSLRKVNGTLNQIQVNGGMHPGNSGGPVIDGSGQVVGVAVSAVAGTQINFAIPIDEVKEFLSGRVISISVDHSYSLSAPAERVDQTRHGDLGQTRCFCGVAWHVCSRTGRAEIPVSGDAEGFERTADGLV